MNKLSVFLFIFIFAISCSSIKNTHLKKELVRGEESFSYNDNNGKYIAKLTAGFSKKDKTFFTKRVLEIPEKEKDNILEQSVSISDIGLIKKRKTILRPKLSQYNVWFEGKKYFSELKMNPAKRAIDVKMISPESKWNGQKQIKLPSSKSLYCFFSQVIECAKTIGFLSEAISKETGVMNFYIVWEGYPYLSETFSDFPSELFSKAQLEFEAKTQQGASRFNLKVGGQAIFFEVDKNEQMKKMFWVSQGISMISRLAKKTKDDSESILKESGGSLE
jgi:hypothetical protein